MLSAIMRLFFEIFLLKKKKTQILHFNHIILIDTDKTKKNHFGIFYQISYNTKYFCLEITLYTKTMTYYVSNYVNI